MGDIKTGSIQITGLADLEKRLMAFSDKLAQKVMNGTVRAGAVVIQKEARSLAPVSSVPHMLYSKRTKSMKARGQKYMGTWITPGNVRKNIKVRLAPRKSRTRPVEFWVYVSQKTAWYWKFLEFGTSKMPAQPFMRPAFDTMKEKATEAMRDYLAQRIDKEAAK